jgi:hypothetical protein
VRFDEVQARTREFAQSVEELQALGEVCQAINSTRSSDRAVHDFHELRDDRAFWIKWVNVTHRLHRFLRGYRVPAPIFFRLTLYRGHVKGFRDQDSRECSLLSTRENHPDRGSLSLWPERRPILVFKNKATGGAYRKRIEDTFVSIACNRADLTTFSIDEANDRSSCGPRRARRARRPGWTRFLATLFFLRGDLSFLSQAARVNTKRMVNKRTNAIHISTSLVSRTRLLRDDWGR